MPIELKTNLVSDATVNILKKFMIFKHIEIHDIRRILNAEPLSGRGGYYSKIAKLCKYNKNEVVIHEGDFDSWSFWVVKGVFDVVQGRMTIATFDKPGEIFGEMSVFEGIPRTASVVSRTDDSICLCIDMSIIDNLNDSRIETRIKEEFYSVILDRIDSAKRKIETDKRRLENKYADLVEFENKIMQSKRFCK